MKPLVQIETNNVFLDSQIKDRLSEVVRYDRPGTKSDMIEIHLDDRDGKVLTPDHGERFVVEIGIEGKFKVNQGTYILDRTDFQGPPDRVAFYASALNYRDAMASHRSRRWDNQTIANIVRSIAAEHGYQAFVDKTYETVAVEFAAQQDQSDILFLRELAEDYGAMFKAQGSSLIFIAQGASKSALMKAQLGRFIIRKQDCSSYRVGREDIGRYTGVKAKWNNTRTPSGETEFVLVGKEDKVYVLPDLYRTKDKAKFAAQAKLDRLIRSEADVTITIPGNPAITCESELQLVEFRERVNGLYVVTEVVHKISADNGFTSRITAELEAN